MCFPLLFILKYWSLSYLHCDGVDLIVLLKGSIWTLFVPEQVLQWAAQMPLTDTDERVCHGEHLQHERSDPDTDRHEHTSALLQRFSIFL